MKEPSDNPTKSSEVEVNPLGPVQLNDGLLAFVTIKSIVPVEAPQFVGDEVIAKSGSFVVT